MQFNLMLWLIFWLIMRNAEKHCPKDPVLRIAREVIIEEPIVQSSHVFCHNEQTDPDDNLNHQQHPVADRQLINRLAWCFINRHFSVCTKTPSQSEDKPALRRP